MKHIKQLFALAVYGIVLSTAFLWDRTAVASSSKTRVEAFGKLPNWYGVWEQFNIGPSGAPSVADVFQILASSLTKPPYKPEWQAKFQASLEERAKHPLTACEFGDFGMLSAMTFAPLSFQMLLTPEEVTLMFYPNGVRHIDTDGRAHPPADELGTTLMGDSIGQWQGSTLVVDTVGSTNYVVESGELGIAPLSDTARITERIRLIDADTLENRLTIEDPVALTKPWEITLHYHRVPTMRHIIPLDCKADRDRFVDGKYVITPP